MLSEANEYKLKEPIINAPNHTLRNNKSESLIV